MTDYVVFTREQFEAGIEEMAGDMFHGGFLTRRAIGPPVEDVVVLTSTELAAKLDAAYRMTGLMLAATKEPSGPDRRYPDQPVKICKYKEYEIHLELDPSGEIVRAYVCRDGEELSDYYTGRSTAQGALDAAKRAIREYERNCAAFERFECG